jgi:hypothetical protein
VRLVIPFVDYSRTKVTTSNVMPGRKGQPEARQGDQRIQEEGVFRLPKN